MRRLYRSRKYRLLGGVCGGLGEYLTIDPTVIRLIWAALALTGWALVVYFLAWLIVPDEPPP